MGRSFWREHGRIADTGKLFFTSLGAQNQSANRQTAGVGQRIVSRVEVSPPLVYDKGSRRNNLFKMGGTP
jgi:hypothetical protein